MGHADELADIFGVPTDGSNIDTDDDISDESQEGAYAAVIKSSEETSFEDKAKAVNEAVAKASNADENETTNSSNEEASDGQSEQQEERDFASIITDAKNAAKGESGSEPDEPLEEQKADDSSSDEPEELSGDGSQDGAESDDDSEAPEQPSPEVEDSKSSEGDEFDALREAGFLVDHPTPMFSKFYEMKRTTLQRHLPDGKRLPTDKWTQEMHDAYVSIRVSLSDKDAIADRMQAIQQKRDRVVQIKSIINSQYFLWKRLIPMMHGQLARVVYEKPAAKQDGVNYEHMRDMEEYYNELEGLFETSKDILNNLDAAYDSLSRQVTLTGIGPSPEKFGAPQKQSQARTTSVADDGFDSLDDNSTVKVSPSRSPKPKDESGGPQEVSF
tara:strand:+ start:34326 stop:35483 length:1158 start_codon:yes stop_codon:yes gene_type:complete